MTFTVFFYGAAQYAHVFYIIFYTARYNYTKKKDGQTSTVINDEQPCGMLQQSFSYPPCGMLQKSFFYPPCGLLQQFFFYPPCGMLQQSFFYPPCGMLQQFFFFILPVGCCNNSFIYLPVGCCNTKGPLFLHLVEHTLLTGGFFLSCDLLKERFVTKRYLFIYLFIYLFNLYIYFSIFMTDNVLKGPFKQ